MKGDEFKDFVENLLRTRREKLPSIILVRSAEANELKNDQIAQEYVRKNDSGQYSIKGIPVMIVDWMLDPVYCYWAL